MTPLGRLTLLVSMLRVTSTILPSRLDAQVRDVKTVTVHYANPNGQGNGWEGASVSLQYAFIPCDGKVTLSYSLVPSSSYVNGLYYFDGRRRPVPATVRVERATTVRFAVTVFGRGREIGRVDDPIAGQALGMGCFAGQTQTLAAFRDILGDKYTPAQQEELLASLTLSIPEFAPVLRNATVEDIFRTERATARRDSLARVAAQEREQQQREQQQREQQRKQAASNGTASASASSDERLAARPGRASQPSQRVADSIAAAAVARRVAADSAAAQLVRDRAAQQEMERARAAAQVDAVTDAVTTAVGMSQALGAKFGAYYMSANDTPALDGSSTFKSFAALGIGLTKRFGYGVMGITQATLSDNYIARRKKTDSYEPVAEQYGMFGQAGLIGDIQVADGFSFGPSLGYSYMGTTEGDVKGVHVGAVVRLGSLQLRADASLTGDIPFKGIGAFLRF